MKEGRDIMGMPITLDIVDVDANDEVIEKVFSLFRDIDERFSTYKETSEISKINRGELKEEDYSEDMQAVLKLCEQTKQATDNYFDIRNPDGLLDPSGLVKGWAILKAAELIKQNGFQNFYIDAGGDIQVSGNNGIGKPWSVGIRNPFNPEEIVKVVYPGTSGVATSGTYLRGQHIYNPVEKGKPLTEVVSLTVIGPNIYEADRFATAAFAMGRPGMEFLQSLPGFEAYMIDNKGIATMTSNFDSFTQNNA